MYVMDKSDDYNDFTNFTDHESDENNMIIKYLLLSIPANMFFSL